MSPARLARVKREQSLMHEIGNYFWDFIEPALDLELAYADPYTRNIACYHVKLVFGVKVTWEELEYMAYH